MMYFKMALKNVKKSYSDYFVYFLTLSISVALFYLFNSFEAQQKILVADESLVFAFRTLSQVMTVFSFFVTLVFGFLIIYANNFILRRRKKEIALYTLLGMKKSKVSRILVYETLIVGFVSLLLGLSFGIILSQGTAAFSGYLMEANMEYQFIISEKAIRQTVLNFSFIFIIVALFNNILISKTKLIDLFKARSKNEEVIVKSPILMFIIMLISTATLIFAYSMALDPKKFLPLFFIVVALGIIGTFGVFYSLSYWLMFIVQRIKNYYYRGLNVFTTRQISSKISSTYKMLSVISLLLLLSFGGIATAFNMTQMTKEMIEESNPYDIQLTLYDADIDSIENNKFFKETDYEFINHKVYNTNVWVDEYELFDNNEFFQFYAGQFTLMDKNEFNTLRASKDRELVSIEQGEVSLFITTVQNEIGSGIAQSGITDFEILGSKFDLVMQDDSYQPVSQQFNSVIVVMNEEDLNAIDKSELEVEYDVNINFDENVDRELESEKVWNELKQYNVIDGNSSYTFSSKIRMENSVKESTLLFTYLGLYLGLTFLIVCVMVISLQVMSETTDNYERYLLLDKIGVPKQLQKQSIFRQTLIYFLLPLIVAIIHSIVGISAVNGSMAITGLTTHNYRVIILSVGILVVIYLAYFIVTYMSNVRMIFNRK